MQLLHTYTFFSTVMFYSALKVSDVFCSVRICNTTQNVSRNIYILKISNQHHRKAIKSTDFMWAEGADLCSDQQL